MKRQWKNWKKIYAVSSRDDDKLAPNRDKLAPNDIKHRVLHSQSESAFKFLRLFSP